MTRSPGIEESRAEIPPGRCFCCDEPLVQPKVGRKRVICRERECVRLYHRLYDEDRRARKRAARHSSAAEYLIAQAQMLRSIGNALIKFAAEI